MFPYKEASCIRENESRAQDGCYEEHAPGKNFVVLITGVYKNFGFEEQPVVCGLMQSNKVNVIYPNTVIDVSTLISMADDIMARINEDWTLYAAGTSENGETVYINSSYEESEILVKQSSVSGENTDVMNDLCFQVTCPNRETAENLLNILNSLNWKTGIIISEWSNLDFLKENKFLIDTEIRGYFCYAAIQEDSDADDYFDSISFSNKVVIWEAFLKYGFSPLEFEWLTSRIYNGMVCRRMEWETALWKTVDRLGFSLVVKENLFQLFDNNGKRLYFSVEHKNSAEKALMKILFPLN